MMYEYDFLGEVEFCLTSIRLGSCLVSCFALTLTCYDSVEVSF